MAPPWISVRDVLITLETKIRNEEENPDAQTAQPILNWLWLLECKEKIIKIGDIREMLLKLTILDRYLPPQLTELFLFVQTYYQGRNTEASPTSDLFSPTAKSLSPEITKAAQWLLGQMREYK